MDRRFLGMSRSLRLWVIIATAFATGVLVERYAHLFVPYDHAPYGLERTFRPFWETWALVDKHYVDHEAVQPERMTRGAIDGMLATLGDIGHTTYLTRPEFQQLESNLAGNLEGIGARISLRNRRPTIFSTLLDSPARAAGLKSGDVVIDVDGKPVAGLPLERIVGMVRGEPGSAVQLRVARPGGGGSMQFSITRAKIDVPDVNWRMLPGLPIAHVAIESFGRQVDAQLKEAMTRARQNKAKAIIIDVRSNGGGLKEQAGAVTSEFLRDGDVMIERDAQDKRTAIPVRPDGVALDIPVCVLIDGGTASSAEIFAGALQDHQRGKLVGSKTFGAGTVLEPFSLSDGSKLLLAISEWLTPNGRRIWRQGISPDINVPLPETASVLLPETETDLDPASLAKSEDKQLLKAIEVLKEQIH